MKSPDYILYQYWDLLFKVRFHFLEGSHNVCRKH